MLGSTFLPTQGSQIKHSSTDTKRQNAQAQQIKCSWLNKAIIYNTERKDDFMYVTEDKLKEMKKYLVNYFINLEHKKIREAQAKINRLSRVKY